MTVTEVFMPVSILGSFGAALYFFTKALTDYLLKKKMVEKGYVNEETTAIFRKETATVNKYSSLKWGLLALFGGIALILMHILDVRADSPLPYGIVAVALSLGFLCYYFIVKKDLHS